MRALILVIGSLVLIVGSYTATSRFLGSEPVRSLAYLATAIGIVLVIAGISCMAMNPGVTENLWLTFGGIALVEIGVGAVLAAQIRGNLTRQRHY